MKKLAQRGPEGCPDLTVPGVPDWIVGSKLNVTTQVLGEVSRAPPFGKEQARFLPFLKKSENGDRRLQV